jgi:SSS family solute:Na+ symporter
VPAIFGAPIWLGFLWRRVTRTAVIVQMAICLMLFAVVPTIFQGWSVAQRHEAWLIETVERVEAGEARATSADVAAGRAATVGTMIARQQVIPPVGVLFERVVRVNPDDPHSRKEGRGRFHAELWVLYTLGVDLRTWSKPQLVAARFYFDAIVPFLLLFVISWVTRPVPKDVLDRFFARVHTPVQPTPEAEAAAIAAAIAHPDRLDADKVFPGSQWEIMKPARSDYIGFFGTWALVGLILLALWGMVNIR